MTRNRSILLAAILVAFGTAEIQAQSFGGGGMGAGGMGGGSAGGSFGSSGGAFGSSGGSFGSSSGGSFGMSGFGNGSFSTGGFGGTSGSSGMTGGVGITNPQASMYGLRSAGAPTGAGQMQGSTYRPTTTSSTGRGGSAQAGGARRRTTTQNPAGGTAAKSPEVWYEPRVEVGFSVAAPPTSVVTSAVNRSFHSATLTSRFGSIQVSLDGETAVLRGTVASANDRQLAEQMALLEPQISSVRNELMIGTSSAPLATPIIPQ
jgi:hypothetical protein